MSSAPALTQTDERDVSHSYEQARRLQLAGMLLPVLATIQGAVFLVSVIFYLNVHYAPPIAQIFAFNTILVGVDAVAHALGIFFVSRSAVRGAVAAVIVPLGATIVIPLLLYDIFPASESAASPVIAITLGEVAAVNGLIVVSGVLTTRPRQVVTTTTLMSLFTVFIVMSAVQLPSAGASLRSHVALLIAFPVLVQWAITGILIASSRTYLTTLRELGDVRVAYRQAQQLDQLKDQFIAHINHELRSPVMAVQGHVELLLLAEDKLSAEERHAYLERAKLAGDDLVALVTSILAMRRLEHEREEASPERVSVTDMLASATRLIDPREGYDLERHLRLNIPEGLYVWADPVRVRQILTNLLSNAVKYSPAGTPVDVSASVVYDLDASKRGWRREPPARPLVEIRVRDYGLGIPPDQIPLLFKRFVRLERDLASSVPGNGLGLFLSRRLAEAMGGLLWVESAGIEGEGSTFHLRLPAPPLATATTV